MFELTLTLILTLILTVGGRLRVRVTVSSNIELA